MVLEAKGSNRLTAISDQDLVAKIKELIGEAPFAGEGYAVEVQAIA